MQPGGGLSDGGAAAPASSTFLSLNKQRRMESARAWFFSLAQARQKLDAQNPTGVSASLDFNWCGADHDSGVEFIGKAPQATPPGMGNAGPGQRNRLDMEETMAGGIATLQATPKGRGTRRFPTSNGAHRSAANQQPPSQNPQAAMRGGQRDSPEKGARSPRLVDTLSLENRLMGISDPLRVTGDVGGGGQTTSEQDVVGAGVGASRTPPTTSNGEQNLEDASSARSTPLPSPDVHSSQSSRASASRRGPDRAGPTGQASSLLPIPISDDQAKGVHSPNEQEPASSGASAAPLTTAHDVPASSNAAQSARVRAPHMVDQLGGALPRAAAPPKKTATTRNVSFKDVSPSDLGEKMGKPTRMVSAPTIVDVQQPWEAEVCEKTGKLTKSVSLKAAGNGPLTFMSDPPVVFQVKCCLWLVAVSFAILQAHVCVHENTRAITRSQVAC